MNKILSLLSNILRIYEIYERLDKHKKAEVKKTIVFGLLVNFISGAIHGNILDFFLILVLAYDIIITIDKEQ